MLPSCRGKDQPTFHPAMDMGGYVVILNAEQVEVTGRKNKQKLYRSHPTPRPGTLKTETFEHLQEVRRHLWCRHTPCRACHVMRAMLDAVLVRCSSRCRHI